MPVLMKMNGRGQSIFVILMMVTLTNVARINIVNPYLLPTIGISWAAAR